MHLRLVLSYLFQNLFNTKKHFALKHSKKNFHILFYVFRNKAVNIFCRLPEWIRNVQMIPGFRTRLGWEPGWKSCMANYSKFTLLLLECFLIPLLFEEMLFWHIVGGCCELWRSGRWWQFVQWREVFKFLDLKHYHPSRHLPFCSTVSIVNFGHVISGWENF